MAVSEALVSVECMWCGYAATKWSMLSFAIVEENVDVWVCDICASAWKQPIDSTE